jgi:S-adenosylmethionine:tRNA ribosyltransferase-isomerase
MTATGSMSPSRISFSLPKELEATEPPEARGLARDEVRLLVAGSSGLQHARFRDLPRFLQPGDLVVVNTSATLAAAVDGARSGGRPAVVHFSTARDDGTWIVELRSPDEAERVLDAERGEAIALPAGVTVRLLNPLASSGSYAAVSADRLPLDREPRLWRARVDVEGPVEAYLARYGRPITYGHLRARSSMSAYQTIFGREPGSAEMPSAARPFTQALVTDLVTRGVVVAPVLLHAGVSSLDIEEPPQPERYRVPAATARLVDLTRRAGNRVVAVGTTVTRALETVARPDATIEPGAGWTELALGPERPARVVDALVTGWHAPNASHLLLLEAVAGARLVQGAYDAALDSGYLWHEFGDSCLLLPERN